MKPFDHTHTDPFFAEPADVKTEARKIASEVVSRLLIWMADAPTLEERGLRAVVALYCIRPDLVQGVTLEDIGRSSGRTKQAIHKLAVSFRATTGFES